jgi:hypothetical protein
MSIALDGPLGHLENAPILNQTLRQRAKFALTF